MMEIINTFDGNNGNDDNKSGAVFPLDRPPRGRGRLLIGRVLARADWSGRGSRSTAEIKHRSGRRSRSSPIIFHRSGRRSSVERPVERPVEGQVIIYK